MTQEERITALEKEVTALKLALEERLEKEKSNIEFYVAPFTVEWLKD